MTRHPLLPLRLLLLLAFVLAGALPQARGHDTATPAALVLLEPGQGILSPQRAVLQALIPDDSATDPVLPHAFALTPPPAIAGGAVVRQAGVAPNILASRPVARGPPAV